MKRVGIDLRATEPGFKAHFGRGTGRYATEVTRRLFGAPPRDLELRPVGGADLIGGRAGQILVKFAPLGKVTLETQLLLPRRIGKLGVDLVHFFAHGDAPARLETPYIVTVLDLIPLRFPELYRANKPGWRFRLARFLELESIRRATGILAISECTKRDLIEMLGVDPRRVAVTPLGVDPRFAPANGDAESHRARLAELGLPARPVLTYVGGIDPRKNVPFLLEAFAELIRRFPRASRPLLVLAGRYDGEREYPALLEQIRRLGIGDDIRLCGFLSDAALITLYHASTVVVFPSLYEGFGLPVLEALACGCPVVAGRNSSIPEVAGDAAVLVPDNERAAWVEAIHRLLDDQLLRDTLAESGIRQAQRFTWEDTASRTADAYRQLLGVPQSQLSHHTVDAPRTATFGSPK